MTGLRDCGSATAAGVVRAGLGTSLCQCRTRADCSMWRDELLAYFQTQRGRKPNVPLDFPNIKTLDKYNRPKVSADQHLHRLTDRWNRAIDEHNLLEVTSSRFNIWGKLYMNWVGPVLLTRFLVVRNPTLPKQHMHQIKPTKQRVKKDTEPTISPPLLRTITFSPFGLTTLQQVDFEGDRAGYWTSKAQDCFEPDHTVKADVPTYLLQRLLPSSVLDPPTAPTKTPRKRKRQTEDGDAGSDTMSAVETEGRLPTFASKRTIMPKSGASASRTNPSVGSRSPVAGPSPICRPGNTRTVRSETQCISLLSDSEVDAVVSHRRSSVIDLGDSPSGSEEEVDDDDLNKAIQLSLQESDAPGLVGSLSREKQRNRSEGVPWRAWKAGAESSSSQLSIRLESTNERIAELSSSAFGLASESSDVAQRVTLQTFPNRSPLVAAISTPNRYPESTPERSAADVRAARLRFFASPRVEGTAKPNQPSVSTQVVSPSTISVRPSAARSFSGDIETIDLT